MATSTVPPMDMRMTASSAERMILLVGYCIITVLIIVLNLVVLFVTLNMSSIKHPSIRIKSSVLIASVLVGGAVPTSGIVAQYLEMDTPEWICRACEFFAFTAITANILSQVGGAYMTLRQTVLDTEVSTRGAVVAVITIWIASLLYASRGPCLYGFRLSTIGGSLYVTCGPPPPGDESAKGIAFRAILLFDTVFLYVIPFTLIACMYFIVAQKINSCPKLATQDEKRGAKNSVRTFIWLTVAFAVFQSPHRCLLLYCYYIANMGITYEVRYVMIVLHLWALLNPIFNPIGVIIYQPAVRARIKQILCCCKHSINAVSSRHHSNAG